MVTDVEIDGETDEAPLSTAAGQAKRLNISLLGGLSVRSGEEALALPRSKKCRALIAYLAGTARPHRREHLCELLWELPDDPKGALRWSLSKIRRVLGPALISDREHVSLDQRFVSIDVQPLQGAAGRLEKATIAELEYFAGSCGGAFGEDLDLPRCPTFQSWLIAVREDARRSRLAILNELLRRLQGDPDRALPFARERIVCDPLDEEARLDLLAILGAAGREEEAEQQRLLAVDTLRQSGIPIPPRMARPLAKSKRAAPTGSALMQRIQFCRAPDGARIAYSAVGTGAPLIKTANWMGHLEFEWESPLLRHWLVELSREHSLVRYDARGNGLSDRSAADLSLEAFVDDLLTVSKTLASERFDLVGISQGCAVAVAFAAKHPEKVRKLVLFGGFARGWRHSDSPEVQARWNAMITLTGLGWGTNNPAFRQMFTSLFVPRAAPEQADWFNELQRVSASPEEAQRLQRAIGDFDVRLMLPAVRAPTIVFHCRDDALVPFGAGRQLAAEIPGAEFVALDSDNHLPLEDEPAWTIFVDRLRDFLSR